MKTNSKDFKLNLNKLVTCFVYGPFLFEMRFFFIYKMSDSSDRELQIIQFVQRVIVLKSTNFIVYFNFKM